MLRPNPFGAPELQQLASPASAFGRTQTFSVITVTADPDLVKTVLDLLSGIGELRQRKMFGGIYIYCDDLFIATVHGGTLYFKANKNTAEQFIDRGLRPFSYAKQGEIATLQYYEAPAEVFTGRAAMKRWASKALVAAQQDASLKKPRKVGGR